MENYNNKTTEELYLISSNIEKNYEEYKNIIKEAYENMEKCSNEYMCIMEIINLRNGKR